MNTHPTIASDSHAASALLCLANPLDTPALDGFIGRLFSLSQDYDGIYLRIENQSVSIDSNNRVLHAIELPRAKSVFRLIGARLAVLCAEWTKTSVDPYGDDLTVHLPSEKHPFLVAFQNTTAHQWIKIELL